MEDGAGDTINPIELGSKVKPAEEPWGVGWGVGRLS